MYSHRETTSAAYNITGDLNCKQFVFDDAFEITAPVPPLLNHAAL